MDHHSEAEGYVGQSVARREDPRLLRGEGVYVADVRLPGVAHMAVLRSPHASARIVRIDVAPALHVPGVIAAFSAADLGPEVPKMPLAVPHRNLKPQLSSPLAGDFVRHVGEGVAVVVAESPYVAEDAIEAIDVEYERLPAVVDAEAALEPGSPLVHEDAEDNLAAHLTQHVGDPDRAFAEADVVVRFDFRFARLSGQPLETRGVVALHERTRLGDRFNVWDSTQSPHSARNNLARMLGLPQHAIRVIAQDVGGGFGVKGRFYAEEFLVPFLARKLGRPIRWVEDRREDLVSATHAREQIHHVEIAARRDGTILGIRDRLTVDIGAYANAGVVFAINPTTQIAGPYRLNSAHIEMRAAYTNKTPMAPYRAAGRPPAVFAIERGMDLVARELGMDPAEVRRRNFIQPDEFPVRMGLIDRDGTEITYDSGSYPQCLAGALKLIDVEGFRREQEAARREGRYLGLGLGTYVESTGRGPFEGATVRVEPSGKVVVATGAAPQGQGHETTLAQLCADRLGVDLEDVTIITGDTDSIGMGIGTFASRTAVVAGNAVSMAARSTRDKALQVAAQLLEVASDDLDLQHGLVSVRGVPDKSLPLARIAQTVAAPPPSFIFPEGLEPGLEATHYFHPTGNTYANGVHAGVVEVDVETGQITVLRYVVVHDCGKLINPRVVDGQVHGGVGQGIGNALYEELVYDEEGRLLTNGFMDYLLPTAMEVPFIATGHQETPSPMNPEGIKGAGEGGTMPVPAVIANAVDDALAPLRVRVGSPPFTPSRVLELIKAADGR